MRFKSGNNLEANGWPIVMSAYEISKASINAYTRLLARKYLCVQDRPRDMWNENSSGIAAKDMWNEIKEELNERLLIVHKASLRGTRPERVFNPPNRIYVGNLPWEVDNAGLKEIFSKHGKVLNVRVVCVRESNRSRGFGFVTMSTKSEMNDAISNLDNQVSGATSLQHLNIGGTFIT